MGERASGGLREPSVDGTIDELDRQVERGSLFTHTALSANADRLHEVEAVLYGVVDVLLARNVVTREAVAQAAEHVRSEMNERGETLGPGVALRVDRPVPSPIRLVNCAERMPVCHAICCKLDFALTAEEIEAGHVRWDLGRPYRIRKGGDGHCVHRDPDSGACGVYANRPGVCGEYSCADDWRIWKDFDAMVLNTAWLEENMVTTRPFLAVAQMRPAEPVAAAAADDTTNGT